MGLGVGSDHGGDGTRRASRGCSTKEGPAAEQNLRGGRVVAVSRSATHGFTKERVPSILLVDGMGVQGDAHAGGTVQHLSRVRADPARPNLRQVHLIPAELFDDLERDGFAVGPGDLGENITTRGIDLLSLPVGTLLLAGADAVIEVQGLRNPCWQIDRFQDGLLKAVLPQDSDGTVHRRAGIMGTVHRGGVITTGDALTFELPATPHRPLERV